MTLLYALPRKVAGRLSGRSPPLARICLQLSFWNVKRAKKAFEGAADGGHIDFR
jgi:hypothetical protein